LIGPQFDLSYLKSRPKDEAVAEAQRIIHERLLVMMESRLPIAPPVPPAADSSGSGDRQILEPRPTEA
jgi:hypothetical protein